MAIHYKINFNKISYKIINNNNFNRNALKVNKNKNRSKNNFLSKL